MKLIWKQKSVIPGFGLSLGFTLFYLGLIVLLPISTLFFKTGGMSGAEFVQAAASPRMMAAYRLTFGASLTAASINAVCGLLVAWVLVRYNFLGKRIVDVLVDLPFALPTAVAGIALTTIYAPNGMIGKWLTPLGVQTAFSPLGIVIALTFISFPFVVRTVQPVLKDLDMDMEEAAACMGAGRLKTFFYIIFPALLPALTTGFALAFARALGEYGSVIFIAGNMPMKTEIVPLLIVTKLEQYDDTGATAIAAVMLAISFVLLLAINGLQGWGERRKTA
ncbi:MAG: sulfate ABC transporter permease subunit CysT [Deltaproteobacteria bacterium]|nr:sulfate ABC transporter permease subunit CysT [Deltaproteobacteria bacterium]